MNNFKKHNKFGGGDRGGFNRGGNDFGRDKQMHKATCADCGRPCEVPFRPDGRKPVYCKDCFAKNGGQVTTNHFSKKPFNPSQSQPSSYAPSHNQSFNSPKPQAQNNDGKFDALTKQLESLNAKFDKLMSITESLVSKPEVKKAEVKPEAKPASAKPAPKAKQEVKAKVVAKKVTVKAKKK